MKGGINQFIVNFIKNLQYWTLTLQQCNEHLYSQM